MSHDVWLGVDYGTSNTVAVLRFPDGRQQVLLFDGAPLMPSSVYAADNEMQTGRDAQRSARADPSRFEPNPKRRIDDGSVLLGDRDIPVTDLIAATLSAVAREAQRVAGRPVTRLALTCPVAWGSVRKSTLAEAAVRAGLPRPTILPEPVAAATYFATLPGRAVAPGQCVVVYDLGGGTFDACVVRRTPSGFEPLAYGGLDDFGGVDLDELIIGQVGAAVSASDPDTWQRLRYPQNAVDRRAFRMLWDDARAAKEELSRNPSAALFVPVVERDLHVSREEFEHAAAPALRRTVDETLQTVRQASLQQNAFAGLFLVGGSTRVPMVATLLHQATGIAPVLLEQPETVVAQGALTAVAPGTRPASPMRPMPVPPMGPRPGPPPRGVPPRPIAPVQPMAAVPPPSAPPASAPPSSAPPMSGVPYGQTSAPPASAPPARPASGPPMGPSSGPPAGPASGAPWGPGSVSPAPQSFAQTPPAPPRPPTMSGGVRPASPGPSYPPAPSPAPPPRSGGRTGLIIGLVAGATVVVVALVFGLLYAVGAFDSKPKNSGSSGNYAQAGGSASPSPSDSYTMPSDLCSHIDWPALSDVFGSTGSSASPSANPTPSINDGQGSKGSSCGKAVGLGSQTSGSGYFLVEAFFYPSESGCTTSFNKGKSNSGQLGTAITGAGLGDNAFAVMVTKNGNGITYVRHDYNLMVIIALATSNDGGWVSTNTNKIVTSMDQLTQNMESQF